MKCPFCNKSFELDLDDSDSLVICKSCNRRYNKKFNLYDFFEENANRFVIMGVFTAIAVLLPQIASNNLNLINQWIQGSASIHESPLSLLIPYRDLFIALSILSSWILMILIGLGIIANLFITRKSELIWFERHGYTIRDGDMGRYMFLIPFLILGTSLSLYIFSLFWNLFQILEIIFIILMFIFSILIITENRSILLSLKRNKK